MSILGFGSRRAGVLRVPGGQRGEFGSVVYALSPALKDFSQGYLVAVAD